MKPKKTIRKQSIKLTEKQRLFCGEYLVSLNATQAAIKAGYSKKTAGAIGWENLKKPEIRDFINEALKGRTISPEETVKLISDISKSSLNDYMVIRKVEHVPKVLKPLHQIVDELVKQIAVEEVVIKVAISDRRKKLKAEQSERKEMLVRLQAELKANPNATKIVNGIPALVEVAEPDLVKLAADKEGGRIKSISYTPNGPKVELHSADQALRDMAKIHGLLQNKLEVTGKIDFTSFLMDNNTVEEEGE